MYPTDDRGRNLGPGSEYICPSLGCGSVWVAHGIRIVNDDETWPYKSSERTTQLGVLFWTCPEWNKEVFPLDDGAIFSPAYEEGLYDFRSLGDYVVPALRALLPALTSSELKDLI